jgi:hypothetical protein
MNGGGIVESEQLILIWDKYEQIAMHFNGLLIHLRTQALGAVATIVTAAGFLLTRSPEPLKHQWWAVCAVSVLLFFAWCTLWMIDVCYYSRLLLGAVNALVKIEKQSGGLLDLSTQVQKLFGVPREDATRLNWQIYAFYMPVGLFLVCVIGVSLCQALHSG